MRKSHKLLKEHAEVMEELKDSLSVLRELEAVQAELAVKLKAAKAAVDTSKAQLAPVLGEYDNATMRRGTLVVRRETVPEKVSRTPKWTAFVDWTKGVFAEVAPEKVAEADEVLDASRKVTPAHDIVVVETQELVVEKA